MNMKILGAAIVLIGASLAPCRSVQAATASKTMFTDPSASCQLSTPTTNTAVRPKATGYRNEGASAAFVICGTNLFSTTGVLATGINIQLTSFDGKSHDASCTAVSRDTTSNWAVYSTQSTTVTGIVSLTWSGPDFGGTFVGFSNTITCTLPTGVAISGMRITFPDEIGS